MGRYGRIARLILVKLHLLGKIAGSGRNALGLKKSILIKSCI